MYKYAMKKYECPFCTLNVYPKFDDEEKRFVCPRCDNPLDAFNFASDLLEACRLLELWVMGNRTITLPKGLRAAIAKARESITKIEASE